MRNHAAVYTEIIARRRVPFGNLMANATSPSTTLLSLRRATRVGIEALLMTLDQLTKQAKGNNLTVPLCQKLPVVNLLPFS